MITATCRLTDDWLPLPAPVLRVLGWREGDVIELEVLDDGTVLATRKTNARLQAANFPAPLSGAATST